MIIANNLWGFFLSFIPSLLLILLIPPFSGRTNQSTPPWGRSHFDVFPDFHLSSHETLSGLTFHSVFNLKLNNEASMTEIISYNIGYFCLQGLVHLHQEACQESRSDPCQKDVTPPDRGSFMMTISAFQSLRRVFLPPNPGPQRKWCCPHSY